MTKRISKKLFCCFITIIMCALLFAGCQPPTSSVSSSLSGGTAPIAEIMPWQRIFHEVASANLTNAQQTQVSDFKIYKYPGFGEIMVGYYWEYPTPPSHKIWQINGDEAVLIYEGPDYFNFLNIKTGGVHLREYHYDTYRTSHKELLNGVVTDLYSQIEDSTSITFVDAATNTEISRAEVFKKYYPTFLPLQESITLHGINEKVVLTEEQQLEKLTEFFLNSYTPNLPQDTPEWIVKTIRYLRTRTNFAYIPGATTAEFSLNLANCKVFPSVFSNEYPTLFDFEFLDPDAYFRISELTFFANERFNILSDESYGGYSIGLNRDEKILVNYSDGDGVEAYFKPADGGFELLIYAGSVGVNTMLGEYFVGEETAPAGFVADPETMWNSEANAWYNAKLTEKLDALGYDHTRGNFYDAPSLELGDTSGTWEDIEQALYRALSA